MATLYKADGTTAKVFPKDGGVFSLNELQEAVGGYIEVIDMSRGRSLVINEEGKLKHLPFNEAATRLAIRDGAIYSSDFIVGDALLCNNNELE